jgi:hypothetical protein
LTPTPSLLDGDPAIAACQRFLEDWSDESLYWYGMALRWSEGNASATVAPVVGDIGAPALFRPLLGTVLRWQIGR